MNQRGPDFRAANFSKGWETMLAKRAQKLDSKMPKGARGVIDWAGVFQMILSLIQGSRKPPTPAPPIPEPNPTPVQNDAWQKAWHLKWNADEDFVSDGEYRGPAFNRAKRGIKKQERKDRTPVSGKEADIATTKLFDDTRAATMPDLYSDILESAHSNATFNPVD